MLARIIIFVVSVAYWKNVFPLRSTMHRHNTVRRSARAIIRNQWNHQCQTWQYWRYNLDHVTYPISFTSHETWRLYSSVNLSTIATDFLLVFLFLVLALWWRHVLAVWCTQVPLRVLTTYEAMIYVLTKSSKLSSGSRNFKPYTLSLEFRLRKNGSQSLTVGKTRFDRIHNMQ
jgi:hypothetical protein